MVALVAPHVRTVKTSSGATAVQIVHSNRRGSRDIEHIGSAHTSADLEVLKAVARERLAAGQGVLDLQVATPDGPDGGVMALPAGALPIRSSRMSHLGEAPTGVFERLGFTEATGHDAVFAALVLARIIEPSSKLDSIRVLHEAGLPAPSYRTIKRRLPGYAKAEFQQQISAACAAHSGLGPASLVLYDVSTLYFETDQGDWFREPGFSNYAEVVIMPSLVAGRWCSCRSTALVGVDHAA